MDISLWVMGGFALVLWTGLTWLVAARWYGRQLQLAAGKISKLNKARQFAAEQASKGREQLQTVQRECAELRQQLALAGGAAERQRRAAQAEADELPSSPIIGDDLHAPMKPAAAFDQTIAIERRPEP